jgi:methylenetetrahydrofolate reductase (NADPH)
MRVLDCFPPNRFAISFEFFPPKTEDGRASLLTAVERLCSISPNFISVTYGAGGGTRGLTLDLCQDIRTKAGCAVMAHLTSIGHTKEELADISDRLWEGGIRNIMALRGDQPRSVANWTPVDNGLPFAKDLIAFLKDRHPFCVGGACYPEGHKETPSIEESAGHAKEKVDAGCDFLVTQMFFDNASYFRFRDLLTANGVSVPLIPGIMPLTAVSQLDKFESQFGVVLPPELRAEVLKLEGDTAAIEEVGVAWATRQCEELVQGGVPGIHFYTLNRSPATVRVCEAIIGK